jgi:small subunit ribosomal protein S17
MKKRGVQRQLIGTVVGNKMDKTAVVQVERLVKHQLYKKFIRRREKYAAHDEKNACQVGDKVLITENRPISRTKRWRVSVIVEKAV